MDAAMRVDNSATWLVAHDRAAQLMISVTGVLAHQIGALLHAPTPEEPSRASGAEVGVQQFVRFHNGARVILGELQSNAQTRQASGIHSRLGEGDSIARVRSLLCVIPEVP